MTLIAERAGQSTLVASSERQSRLTRDRLLVVLGILWLLDAALQYQPVMFGKGFFSDIVLPVTQGQPAWVNALVQFGHRFVGSDIGWFNIFFATLQLLIGVSILARYRPRLQRLGLAVSIAWCAVIWVFGEGLGQIFSNQGSGLIGSPGSALLYGIMAVLLWPKKDPDPTAVSVASSGLIGDLGGRIAWAILWVGLAILSLDGSNMMANSYSQAISSNVTQVPHILGGLYYGLAHDLTGQGMMLGVMTGSLELVIGLGVLVKDRGIRNFCLAMGIAISLFYWVAGQAFGGVFSGTGTDPNSGPLFVLLALAIWAVAPTRRRPEAERLAPPPGGLASGELTGPAAELN
jgi:uncharacterized membrane protein